MCAKDGHIATQPEGGIMLLADKEHSHDSAEPHLSGEATMLLADMTGTIRTASREELSEIHAALQLHGEGRAGATDQYRDTVYQDRYQDTPYDDHYADSPGYRDGAR